MELLSRGPDSVHCLHQRRSALDYSARVPEAPQPAAEPQRETKRTSHQGAVWGHAGRGRRIRWRKWGEVHRPRKKRGNFKYYRYSILSGYLFHSILLCLSFSSKCWHWIGRLRNHWNDLNEVQIDSLGHREDHGTVYIPETYVLSA